MKKQPDIAKILGWLEHERRHHKSEDIQNSIQCLIEIMCEWNVFRNNYPEIYYDIFPDPSIPPILLDLQRRPR